MTDQLVGPTVTSIKFGRNEGEKLFNRVHVGFNRVAKWDRIFTGVKRITETIPVYVHTVQRIVIDMIR